MVAGGLIFGFPITKVPGAASQNDVNGHKSASACLYIESREKFPDVEAVRLW